MASVLISNSFDAKVSSVLNKDIKQFGKKFLFDGKDDTCWNSDQGSPQWVFIDFKKEVEIDGFSIQFQGGFVGQDCSLELYPNNDENVRSEKFYPEDTNSFQYFPLSQLHKCTSIKINFCKSTDFFGRIIIYKLDILRS